ncbi:MAG: hypothetical protein R6V60_11915 [Desulfobacterales bacterium]
MAGAYDFPGGRVEPQDRNKAWETQVDLSPEEIFQRIGGDLTLEEALAHGMAAIRETFEEAGVLPAAGENPGPSLRWTGRARCGWRQVRQMTGS